jgi:hypothetical protein
MYTVPVCCMMASGIRKEVAIEVPPKIKDEGKSETP